MPFMKKPEEKKDDAVVQGKFGANPNPFLKSQGAEHKPIFGGADAEKKPGSGIVFNFNALPKTPAKAANDSANKEASDGEEANDSPPTKLIASTLSTTTKLFQKQIVQVELLKLTPKTLDAGFISIEYKQTSDQHFLIYRSFSGMILFNGLLLLGATKVKDMAQEQEQRSAKITTYKYSEENNKYDCEHCIIRFVEELDKENFVQVVKAEIGKHQAQKSQDK